MLGALNYVIFRVNDSQIQIQLMTRNEPESCTRIIVAALGEIQRHTGQPSVPEIDAHTMYNQWATFTAILSFFCIWPVTPGINMLLLSTGALGSLTCSGMTLPIFMGPTALRGIRATGDTLSNVESQVFTPYHFGSSRDRTPDLLTTRSTCQHLATALCRTSAIAQRIIIIPTLDGG